MEEGKLKKRVEKRLTIYTYGSIIKTVKEARKP